MSRNRTSLPLMGLDWLAVTIGTFLYFTLSLEPEDLAQARLSHSLSLRLPQLQFISVTWGLQWFCKMGVQKGFVKHEALCNCSFFKKLLLDHATLNRESEILTFETLEESANHARPVSLSCKPGNWTRISLRSFPTPGILQFHEIKLFAKKTL